MPRLPGLGRHPRPRRFPLLLVALPLLELEVGEPAGARESGERARRATNSVRAAASALHRPRAWGHAREHLLAGFFFPGSQHLRQQVQLLLPRREHPVRCSISSRRGIEQVGDDFESITLVDEKLLPLRRIVHLLGVGRYQRVEEGVELVLMGWWWWWFWCWLLFFGFG